MKTIKTAIAIGLGILSFVAMAESETVGVSTQGYNRFTFASPFEAVVLPPEAPVASQPVALGGNTTLLIELERGIKAPVQMVVQMANGQVYDLTLEPGAKRPAVWIQPSGDEGRAPIQRPTDERLVNIFKDVLADPNTAPKGYREIARPNAGRMHGLTVDYVAAYESRSQKLYVMRLRSDRLSPIIPQDLYVRGVKAVYIEGDAVGPQMAPLAVILKAKEG